MKSIPRLTHLLVPTWLLMFLLSPLSAAGAADQLDVQQQIWGFDGRAVADRFVPLSLLIVNVSDRPFDGELTLSKGGGVGGRVGAKIVKRLYLSPGSGGWVQFLPYMSGWWNTDWTLSWSQGSDRQDTKLMQPRTGRSACVILDDSDDPIQRPTKLKRFPDSLFPICAAATDALGVVALDHVPRWGPQRRKAFVNWLWRGGTVCVIHTPTGSFPHFEGDLAPLNAPSGRARAGAGLVVRHQITRQGMSQTDLTSLGLAQPTVDDERRKNRPLYDVAQMLSTLRRMTKPKHNWAAMFTLSVLYVVLICPVNWLVGRRKDYRLTLLLFIGFVAAFGWVFFSLGKRGYGERGAVHTLSYVRPATPGVHDVTQWGNVFVIAGAAYTITHDSEYNLYSTCLDMESVRGVLQNGVKGRFVVDMPLYSNREFVHRGQVAGDKLIDRIAAFRAGATLESLELVPGPGFPDSPEQIWAFHGDSMHQMRVGPNGLVTLTSHHTALDQFLEQVGQGYYGSNYGVYYDDRDEDAAAMRARLFPYLAKRLIAERALDCRRSASQGSEKVLAVQLFVVAKTPRSLHINGDQFGSQFGRTVYHVSLPRPEETELD